MSTCLPCMGNDHNRCRYIEDEDCVCKCTGPTSRHINGRPHLGATFSPAVRAAAKALYRRLRVADDSLPKWRRLDVDTRDHYCIAALAAVTAFQSEAARDVEVKS